MNDNALVARRRLFSSAHFYKQCQFTDEENRRTFGACYTPFGHGHNYVLEIFIEGPIDPESRRVIQPSALDGLLEAVTAPLDHHHLNFDLAPFKGDEGLVPTTENIALYLRAEVLKGLGAMSPALRLKRLRLFETDDLWVELEG